MLTTEKFPFRDNWKHKTSYVMVVSAETKVLQNFSLSGNLWNGNNITFLCKAAVWNNLVYLVINCADTKGTFT